MVYLTTQEQKMLDGEFGEATQEAMEILVALAKIYNAKNMTPVSSAQIAGVSYATIGDAGMEYLKGYARKGAKVKIPAFLNPAGMDLEQWREMKVPENFAKKQIEIMNAYVNMGIKPTATCTPYLIGIRPKKGEHVAWSESSAVAFANSVLGARTNREGGPSALAAAICGITPNYGLHLDENRVCSMLVKVEARLEKISDFGALGYYVGEIAKGKSPAFSGIKKATEDQLKSLGAAMAASGSVALYNVENITPEYDVCDDAEKITITEKELKETKEKLNETKKIELMTFGCPHASLQEIKKIAEKIKGKKLKDILHRTYLKLFGVADLHSHIRYRAIKKYFQSTDKNVEIGAGSGLMTFEFAKETGKNILGVIYEKKDLNFALETLKNSNLKNVSFIQGGLPHLKLKENYYDQVLLI
ncbi:MAG: aconitase X, partial [Candidatus Micrarchaeia archaeon]